VTGLVAQQQTVGPLQLPLADVAVLAQVCTCTIAATLSCTRGDDSDAEFAHCLHIWVILSLGKSFS
jgi:hypothetical protein